MTITHDLQKNIDLRFDKNRSNAKVCPCGEANRTHFAPYVGFDDKGYCHKCEKTFLPELSQKEQKRREIAHKIIGKPISLLDNEILKKSLVGYKANHFVTLLISLFGEGITSDLISKYYIGTSKYWDSATVFWQIDSKGKIRTGKIMLYDPHTGKRVKEPHKCITWVHTALKLKDYNLKQCLFGEHLLIGSSKPIALVESEKTAIISSVYLPQFLWLATGGISNLKLERCNVLKGKNVTLFPDTNSYKEWSEKARELSNITNFKVSDLLESKASEIDKQKGYDIADVLMGFNYKEFIKPKEKELERIEIEPPFNYLDYFQQRAKADYNKCFYGKRIVESFNNYLSCWYNDMKKILFEHSISKEQFFKEI